MGAISEIQGLSGEKECRYLQARHFDFVAGCITVLVLVKECKHLFRFFAAAEEFRKVGDKEELSPGLREGVEEPASKLQSIIVSHATLLFDAHR